MRCRSLPSATCVLTGCFPLCPVAVGKDVPDLVAVLSLYPVASYIVGTFITGTNQSIRGDLNNQNHGSVRFGNASITTYHYFPAAGTTSTFSAPSPYHPQPRPLMNR